MNRVLKNFHLTSRFCVVVLMIFIVLACLKSDAIGDKETGIKNLIKNPSFESGTDNWSGRGDILIDKLASDGKYSIAIKALPGESHLRLWQTIAGIDLAKFQGKELILKAKVYISKGKGAFDIGVRQLTVGEEFINKIPRVSMNNSDKENQMTILQHETGTYQTVEERPGEWISLESKGFVSPKTSSMAIEVEAWPAGSSETIIHIDDIFFGEVTLPIIEISLSKKIYYLNEEKIQFVVQLNLQDDRPENFQLIVKLDQKEQTYQFSSKKMDFAFPIKGFSKGKFLMECTLIDKNKNIRNLLTFPIEIMESPFD